MKRRYWKMAIIYSLMFCFLNINMVVAQRMVPGQKGVEVTAGVLSDGNVPKEYFISIAFTIHAKAGNYNLISFEYNHQLFPYKNREIPLEAYFLEGGYSVRLIEIMKGFINVNIMPSLVVGYEQINKGNKELNDGAVIISKDSFLYGGGGTLSVETYFSDKIIFLLKGKVKVVIGSDLEVLRPGVGVGFRFNL